MRNEIGSEFWEIPIAEKNNIFPDDTKWFVSGRSALKAIIAENSFKTVALPVWCCDSMIKPFIDSGISVSFYYDYPEPSDAALVMDYFGYTSNKDYYDYPGIVIRDITHSLFSTKYADADYCFGSLRKWAGFWTGGFAWGFNEEVLYSERVSSYIDLRKKAMNMKTLYIEGKNNSKEYLSVFEQAENELEGIGILHADQRDVQAALHLDVIKIKKQRRKNAEILMDKLSKYALYPEIRDNDCPMFVPIITEKRNELRQYLIKNRVYCPVHWPVSDLHRLSPSTRRFYDCELSLVCDQRYGCPEMEWMIELINYFLKNEG